MPGGSALWSTTTTRRQAAETLVTGPPIDVRYVFYVLDDTCHESAFRPCHFKEPRDLAAAGDRRTLRSARPANRRAPRPMVRDLTFILRIGNHFVHYFGLHV